MKYYMQLVKHDAARGQWGDCFRTCIACVFDMNPSTVPHFFESGITDGLVESPGWRLVDVWLDQFDLELFTIRYPEDLTFEQIAQSLAYDNPKAVFMVGGKTKTGVHHVVLSSGGKMLHDPSGSGNGLASACTDGYWRVYLFVSRRASV